MTSETPAFNSTLARAWTSALTLTASVASVILVVSLVLVICTDFAVAGTKNEVEPNNDFATRQILGRLDTQVDAEITDLITSPDFGLSPVLVSGAINSVLLMIAPEDAMPGDPFLAWIDNLQGEGTPDTLMAVVDIGGNLVSSASEITSGDDASPEGSGTASALLGVVESDGFIRLEVTGQGDNSFNGSHTEAGDFDLLVSLGELDVDFFSWENLIPGKEFTLLMTPMTGSTLNNKTLLWLDNDGLPMSPPDDPIYFFLPFTFDGTVPACDVPGPTCGVLNFAVAGGEDTNADGIPDMSPADSRVGIGSGEYTLVLTPEPTRTASVLAALVVVSALARRRRVV